MNELKPAETYQTNSAANRFGKGAEHINGRIDPVCKPLINLIAAPGLFKARDLLPQQGED